MGVERTAQVGAIQQSRSRPRTGQRKGHYQRSLLSVFGLVRELLVPRLRKGGPRIKVFQRYRRPWKSGESYIRSLFFGGASTREVGELVERLWGVRLSSSAVSEVVRVLDVEVRKFHKRTFEDVYRFLFLDGAWVRVSG